MASATKATRGFNCLCPRCGDEGVRVALWDVDNLFCVECDAEFTLDDVRALVTAWGPVIRWLDTAPVMEE
jgi:uncharacterized protein (DUF983 family)